MTKPEEDRPTNGGFGSQAEKKNNQVITPGHQHGQKRMPSRTRGSAIHHKRPGSHTEHDNSQS